jgi:hypothetical protein
VNRLLRKKVITVIEMTVVSHFLGVCPSSPQEGYLRYDDDDDDDIDDDESSEGNVMDDWSGDDEDSESYMTTMKKDGLILSLLMKSLWEHSYALFTLATTTLNSTVRLDILDLQHTH